MIIYLAGHYRAKTVFGKALNILKAYIMAIRISRRGYVVFCPHMNTCLFDLFCHHDDIFWLKAGLDFLKRCDAIFLMKGWQDSHGSIGEYYQAKNKCLPIYKNLDELSNGGD